MFSTDLKLRSVARPIFHLIYLFIFPHAHSVASRLIISTCKHVLFNKQIAAIVTVSVLKLTQTVRISKVSETGLAASIRRVHETAHSFDETGQIF